MKVLIVDDEPLALRRLERLLKEAGLQEILKAENAYEAKRILEINPDVDAVFLDVRMPGKDGLKLAREILGERDDVFIVFQTAYDEYTLPAFEVGAVGYLIKPFFFDDIVKVLNRIRKFKGEKPRIFVFNKEGKLVPTALNEIYYFEAQLKHSQCVKKEGSFHCPKSIGYLEEVLKLYGFLRVHKSYLVNLEKIKNITSLPDGRIEITFKEIEKNIITSKLGAKKLREILKI
ncbi:response regulator transcription factor [Thermodesulfobacterium sp. TA1]|uniref:Response regulator transcription factor n=1 Tax=Thermodesulfobacterium geofontis TaxID=1295609 RepID=A0A7C4JQN5_9BACT|nr:LytTR family DNA-binding domain-containing protein [Thermodesulfobacterium sp. TA1]QER41654.1 response regulator transcription factor [Thermodesulfobacterium sp. TA1]